MASSFELQLVAARALSPTVRELTLERVDGEPVGHQPGQWIDVHLDVEGRSERRAYSIASAPKRAQPSCIELAVTRVDDGPVSCALHALEPGARLRADGPHGFFTREGHEDARALYVGTGTGLCPLRAMIQQALEGGADGGTLLFGCRDRDHVLWASELDAWQASGKVDVQVTLSRPDAEWNGLRGYVQEHVAKLASGEPRPHVYVCGLSEMVRAVRKVLKSELGYDRRHIHTERYD